MDYGLHGEYKGEVLVFNPDTNNVERQVAYYNDEREHWAVQGTVYLPIEQTVWGVNDPQETTTNTELSQDDLKTDYPELWKEIIKLSGSLPTSDS